MYKTHTVATLDGLKSKLLAKRRITPSGCWEYTGYVDRLGYGVVVFKRERFKVHRLSVKFFKPEEYRETLQVNHKCNNTKCFNPDHLYCGDGSDNQKDSVAAGTHRNSSKTYCIRGHEFTPENTMITSKGARQCKICYKLLYTCNNMLKR